MTTWRKIDRLLAVIAQNVGQLPDGSPIPLASVHGAPAYRDEQAAEQWIERHLLGGDLPEFASLTYEVRYALLPRVRYARLQLQLRPPFDRTPLRLSRAATWLRAALIDDWWADHRAKWLADPWREEDP